MEAVAVVQAVGHPTPVHAVARRNRRGAHG
jgi:hypothetical protein